MAMVISSVMITIVFMVTSVTWTYIEDDDEMMLMIVTTVMITISVLNCV